MILMFTTGQRIVVRKQLTFVKRIASGKSRWHLIFTVGRKVHTIQLRDVLYIRPGVKL